MPGDAGDYLLGLLQRDKAVNKHWPVLNEQSLVLFDINHHSENTAQVVASATINNTFMNGDECQRAYHRKSNHTLFLYRSVTRTLFLGVYFDFGSS